MAAGDSKEVLQEKAKKSKAIQENRMQKPTPKGQFRTDNPCILRDGSVDPQCKKVYQRSVAGREKGEDFVKSLDAQGKSEKDIFMATVQKLMNRSLGYVGAYLDSKNQSRRYNQKEAMAIADAIMSKAGVGENPGARLTKESDDSKQKRAETREQNKATGATFEKGKKASPIRQQRREPGGRGKDALGMPETWQKPGSGVDEKTGQIRKEAGLKPTEPGKVKSDVEVDETSGTAGSRPQKRKPPEQKVPPKSQGIDPSSPVQRRLQALSKKPEPTPEQRERLDLLMKGVEKGEVSQEEFQAELLKIMSEVESSGGAAREEIRGDIRRKKEGEGRGTTGVPIPGSKAAKLRQAQVDKRVAEEKEEMQARLDKANAVRKAKTPKVDEDSQISKELKKGGLGAKLETSRKDWLKDDDDEGVEETPQTESQPEEVPAPAQKEEGGAPRVSAETAEAFERLMPNLSTELNKQIELQARVNSGIKVDPNAKLLPKIVSPGQAAAVKAEVERLKKDPEQINFFIEESIFNIKDLYDIEDPDFDNLATQYLNNFLSGGRPAPAGQQPEPEPPSQEQKAPTSPRETLPEERLGRKGKPAPSGEGFKITPQDVRKVKQPLKKAIEQGLSAKEVAKQYTQGTLFPSGLVTETSATNPLEGGSSPAQESPEVPESRNEELGGNLFDDQGNPNDFRGKPPARRESTRQIPLPLGRENTAQKLAARAKVEERRLAKEEKKLGKPPSKPRKGGRAPVQPSLFTAKKQEPRKFNTSEMSYEEFSQSVRSLLR